MSKMNESECAVQRDWVAAAFGLAAGTAGRPAQLRVLRQKFGPCAVNASLTRDPLRIGDRTFARGLAVHGVSEIVVELPGPAKRFLAAAGRDQNAITTGNAAAITFSVASGTKELYHSPVIKGGEAPLELAVPLRGQTKFVLKVDGSEDWAHADWADARIELADGRTLWLDELPFTGALPAGGNGAPPFSFLYGGKPFAELAASWKKRATTKVLDACRTRRRLVFTDPKSGLEVRCGAVVYRDYPAVEWVVHFTNTGKKDTPILENLQALDLELQRGAHDHEFVLHHAVGSICAERDFAPLQQALPPRQAFTLAPLGGRSSSGTLPFFNLESPGSGGVIGAVGWTGQWQATFQRDTGGGLAVRAGMELTHLKLHPGESIRTPSILLLFWRGADRVRSQNLLRSLILRHYTPQPSGKPLEPPVAWSSWGMFPEPEMLRRINILKKARLPLDCFWIDAGWYGDCQRVDDWYGQAGNWHPNPRLFPAGLASVGQAAHRAGCKFLLWFDVERVYKGTVLHREHPEWLLRLAPELQLDPFTGAPGYDGNYMLNLGDPAARGWAVETLSRMIAEAGIDILREDFNFDPLPFWRHYDAPDRQGMTEIRYISGLYGLLDELLKRHPHLEVDNCASGGRRLDLEMTRRSIPLWRSDLQCSGDYSALGSQSQTFGLASWLPLNCAGSRGWLDTYDFRSALSAGSVACWTSLDHPAKEWAWARKMQKEAVLLRPLFQGDFYPLTNYSLCKDVWLAYQLQREDLGEGAVLAYRREQAPYPSAVLKLHALDPEGRYEVRNLDSGKLWRLSGAALMTDGVEIRLDHAPDCVILVYRKRQ